MLITAYLYSARCMIFIGPRTDHSLSLSPAYPCLEDLNYIRDYDRPVVHIFDADFLLRLLHYQAWSFHLLEYQWSEDEFDTLGKSGSAHRVQGTPPLEGGVSSGQEDPSPRQQPDPTSSNLTRRFRKVYDSANLNGPGR